MAPVTGRAITCPHCGARCYLDHRWDSYVCPDCVEFTEDKCSDEDCSYCVNRPDTPEPRPVP